uniref:hypothetical protein n=1 Tax=Fibrobacter sp. TaxID=35828 RepID=UPI003868E154
MNNRYIKLGVATFAISLGLSACGDDVLLSEEHFTTVNSLNAEDCNEESEGSMAFVKSTATMYACSEGEWIAMSDKEAIKYRCSSKELSDKSGFAIICDGDTIGVVNNGKDGANGKDGINGKDGANGQNGSDGTNGTNGKDGDPGTNGSNGVSVDTAAINKAIRDAFSSASAKSQSDVNNAINAMNSAASQNQSDVNNALKNLSSASAKNQSDVNNALKNLSSASAKNQDDVNNALKNLSSASAKNQSDVNNALNDLSSASAKNQNDLNNALGNLSSATDKFGEDINKKFNDAYSSWNAELKDRSCAITDTVRDYEKAIITVTIHCGDAETTMGLPFTIVNKNLTNVYKKHVVVRLPVQSTKETKTQDIYEEIWKNFKGGDNAELSVIDLDTNYNATGKLFIADLFADASKAKSFVTIEETNEKIVEYKVVRLEGDLDVTNLTTPVAQLRVKLNLTSPAGFSAFGGFGSNGTDVIYNALVDLTDADPEAQDASDTVVIDFLTDYKAARTKVELKSSATFAEASAKANKELAAALNLKYKNSDEYPAFEHYLPTQIDLEEYFNSVVWVMALIDQKDKTPGFNAVYNAYRDLFAEKGNFKTAVKTTYAGREQDMFLVDYIALLIDANFVQWAHWTNEGAPYQNRWTGSDAGYYKIVQDGFVHSYGLTTAGLVPYADYPDKLFKSDAKGGYFRYFVYYEESKTWWPLGLDAAAVATVEGIACDANTVGNTYLYSFEGLDDNAVCTCENDQCYWEWSQNVCVGRSAGDKGTAVYVYEGGYVDILDYECVAVDCDGSETSECVEVVTNWGSLFSSSSANSSSSSAEQNGKTPEEVANDPSSKLYLGTCDATNQGSEKQFNLNNAQLATTTGMVTYVCDGVRWRQKTYEDEMYGTCTKSKMEEA